MSSVVFNVRLHRVLGEMGMCIGGAGCCSLDDLSKGILCPFVRGRIPQKYRKTKVKLMKKKKVKKVKPSS